jgi:hypothetical protein
MADDQFTRYRRISGATVLQDGRRIGVELETPDRRCSYVSLPTEAVAAALPMLVRAVGLAKAAGASGEPYARATSVEIECEPGEPIRFRFRLEGEAEFLVEMPPGSESTLIEALDALRRNAPTPCGRPN